MSTTDTNKMTFMQKYNLWGVLFGAAFGGFLFMMRSNSFVTGKIMHMIVAALATFLVVELSFGVLKFIGLDMSELNSAFLTAVAVFFGMSGIRGSGMDSY